MSYMNDPREMTTRPEGGGILEQDNRHETMYQWGAMILDLCDMPVSEYMKPMTVIGLGGGGSVESGNTPTTVTEEVKIYLSIYRNDVLISGEDVVLSAADDEPEEIIWKAQWEWTGSFPGQIRVAATITTDEGDFLVSKDLIDNESKMDYEIFIDAQGDHLVSFQNYGVGSVETPKEEIVSPTYTEIIKDEEVEYKYEYEISTEEKIVYLTLKLTLDGATKLYKTNMRYKDVIPFETVQTEKDGYTFTGWYDSKGNLFEGTTMPAYDLTLKGKYEAKKCNVEFYYIIDGDEQFVTAYTVNYGKQLSKMPSNKMTGYTFKGWEPSISTSTIIRDDMKVYGTFESIVYTMTWNGYPEGPIVQEYKYKESVIEPIAPEKFGHTFKGWDKIVPQYAVSSITFNAVFTANKHVVTFSEEWYGVLSELSTKVIEYGETITLPKVPSVKGYTYSDWQSDYTGTTMPDYDIEYKTVKTVNTYVIAYYDNGVLVGEETYEYLQEVNPLVYEKEGWTVSDWNGIPSTMPYNNVSAYCTSVINYYVITFVDQDGNTYIAEAPYGSPIKDFIPEIEGKTFLVDEETMNSTLGASDITIEGIVKVNNYKVVITVDGEVSDVTELPYGTNIEDYIKENFPAEEGYEIIIESTHETVPADNSLVVNVLYKANVWVLTYSTTGSKDNLNGSMDVEYGTKILPLLPNTEKEGYDFSGWYVNEVEVTEEFTMPNNDITVSGDYDIKRFIVTILDGENSVFNGMYAYGTPISDVLSETVLVDYVVSESANGYTVEFFYNDNIVDETMTIKEDITLNINRTPNKYVLTFKNGNEVISEEAVEFGSVITYPSMSNKEVDGVEYVFVWDNSSYNGKGMPNMDLVITGNYVEKSIGEIYFGSFVVAREDASRDNLVQYFNESDLYNGVYGSVKVNDCIDVYKGITITIPVYEPFVELEDYIVSELRSEYYAPLTLVIPVDVVNKYNVSIKDDLADYWEDYITDREIINVNGVDCYFFVRYSDNVTPDRIAQPLEFNLKLSQKKQYTLTFKNGEEVISSTSKYEGETIVYPEVENKEIDGNVYMFVWEDETYNGKPMPSNNLEINGSYQMKAKDPIYYGSFVIEKSEVSMDNVSQYFDESQLNTYNTIDVDSCIDKDFDFTYIIPAYEPFVGLEDYIVSEIREEYYAPLTLILPKDVYETYKPSIIDGIGADYWGDYVVDTKTVKINGSEFVFCVRFSDNVTPDMKSQYTDFKLKLTKK